jgi:hypothetical protein
MATLQELEKTIEQLREQVASLQNGFEQFQRLLLDTVETRQLKVSESVEIAGHNIGQTLNDLDSILSNHDTSISATQATANDAVNKADQAQGTADNANTLVQNLLLLTQFTSDRGEDTKKDWWKAQNAAHKHCQQLGYQSGFMIGESPDGKIYPIVCLK